MLFRLFGWVRVIFRYYGNFPFAFCDTLLWISYLLKNPHRISRTFSRSNLYGETPLTTLDKIARECRILSDAVVYELGCGTGRTCFWLSHFVKCKAVGIDHIPTYINRANRVKKISRTDRVSFQCADFFEVSLEEATLIYLYGTAMEDEWIVKLTSKLATLPKTTRIISTSYPLSDYDKRFETLKTFRGHFPWGRTDIYLNGRVEKLPPHLS
ncbi:MAG: hypothetical protein S4CHLAM45_08840 [Chlamydiales bacterium]|nr:hypothetical protein [Chlamydiales bacterium]MCH9620366.1 hypothetical protein [Chlamydiales bacterium]MCH9622988.1 hypothetical protein [Chlamydiales bacterium]